MIHFDISLLEAIWLLIVTPGLILNILVLRDVLRDRESLKVTGINGIAKLTVDSAFKVESVRLVKMVLLEFVGLAAAAQPDVPSTAFGYVVSITLIIYALGVTYTTAVAFTTRKRILDILGVDTRRHPEDRARGGAHLSGDTHEHEEVSQPQHVEVEATIRTDLHNPAD